MASKAWVDTASLRLRERDHTVLAGYHKHGRLLDGGAFDQAEAADPRASAAHRPRRSTAA